jgi:hypothetical protein
MADAGVNIEVQYGDHDNQLILVVVDMEKAAKYVMRGRVGGYRRTI